MTMLRRTAVRPPVLVSCLLAGLALWLSPATGRARGPEIRECSPGGPPSALGSVPSVELTRGVQRQDNGWLVASARSQRPRLFSATGEAIELPQAPASADTTDWIARGRAVFAVGTSKSQADGKTHVVLLRWGVDNRPRVTALNTVEAITGPPLAALSGEHLMVVWAERARDGKSHVRLSVVDLEELRVETPSDLGAQQGEIRLAASDTGFTLLWTSGQGLQRALFDAKGKPSGAPTVVRGLDGALRAVQRCDDRTWVMHDAGQSQVAIASVETDGAVREVAKLDSPPEGEPIAARCIGQPLALGHRVVSKNADNVVFWISTIDGKGKLRQRKIKDLSGPPEAIHSLALTTDQAGLRAWWLEDEASSVRLWAREVVCK